MKHAVWILIVSVCLFRICFSSDACRAADIHVPDDYGTIQAAIDAAAAGDSVLVADGTWTGDGNVNLWPGGKAITIRSASENPENCIIDCESTAKGFFCNSGETGDTVITGFTIRNSRADATSVNGTGCLCVDTSPVVSNCIFENCHAVFCPPYPGGNCFGSGGAIACFGPSNPIIIDCAFIDCESALHGGAIYCSDTSVTITNCRFTGNTSYENGGAMYFKDGDMSVSDCIFSENRATTGNGGTVYICNAAGSFASCSFACGIARKGGALAIYNAVPVIGGTVETACTFRDNIAGAGADLYGFSPPETIPAQHNIFHGITASDYYVYPVNGFDLTGSQSLATPITSDVFVDPDGSNTNDGLSADTPFKNIQYAMSRILPSEDSPITVHLAAGSYSFDDTGEIFPIPMLAYVTLQGVGPFMTQLAPCYDYNGIYALDDSPVAICNLGIYRGGGDEGGGIHADGCDIEITGVAVWECTAAAGAGVYLFNCDARLSNCRITDNYSRYQNGATGICSMNGTLHVSNSIIARNSADLDAAGIYVEGESVLFNCRIVDNVNRLGGDGAGVYSMNGPLTMVNCTVRNNLAMAGAGVYATGTFTIINSLITDNQGSRQGVGLAVRDGDGILRHTTIAGNYAQTQPVSSVSAVDSIISMDHIIVWNASGIEIETDNASVTAAYCAVRDGYPGAGNISDDPMFTTRALSDYYLEDDGPGGLRSPCIDAGSGPSSDFVYSGDWGAVDMSQWTATARWIADDGTVDMGCHWNHSTFSGVKLDLSQAFFYAGDTFTLDAVLLNHSGASWAGSRLFVMLDIAGSYWFAPDWIPFDQGIDSYPIDIESGQSIVASIIPEFSWPDNVGDADNIGFWGALTDDAVTQLRGTADFMVFGYNTL